MFDSDSDDGTIYVKPQAKSEFDTEPKLEFSCWVCGKSSKNDIGRQTHINNHWCEIEPRNHDFDIKSSVNLRQLYITISYNNLI